MSYVKKNKENKFHHKKFGAKKKTWKLVNEEVALLQERISNFDQVKAQRFNDYPLCKRTLKGLANCKFETPTAIQHKTLIPSLRGEDIVGAAKTGSGKTLAFIIPILEKLYKLRWSKSDGVGALVITPTRELATQIFKVINSVGSLHDFSVGLVTGGKNMKEEERAISSTNIILATPGRMLHHLDKTYSFTLDNLQVLVLDEADRMLDEGFKTELNHIIKHLPPDKQTLLYSATQTKMVEDIARLKMKDWLFVSAEASNRSAIPELLRQHYVICELHDKFNFLWTFVTKHRKKKAIVFVSTCKQARFLFEIMSKMQPSVVLLCLHGAMSHKKRLKTCETFNNKRFAYLIATDVAARGLDFKGVDSVMQYDSPDDVSSYIHRVGRTARYNKDGDSWLMLLPSEKQMIENLNKQGISLQLQKVKANVLNDVTVRVRHFVFTDKIMTDYAKKAFSTYLKSIYMKADKKVFDVNKLNYEAFARSLGLQDAPKVRYIIKQERIKKNVVEKAPREEEAEKKENEKEEKEEEEEVVDEEGDEDEDDEEENDVEEDVDDADSDQNEILDEKIDNKRSGKKNIEDKLKEVREKLRNKMKNMANEGSDVATSNKKKASKQLMNKKIVYEDDEQENTVKKARLEDLLEEMKRQDKVDKENEKVKRKKEKIEKKEKIKKKIKEKEEETVELGGDLDHNLLDNDDLKEEDDFADLDDRVAENSEESSNESD